MDELAKVIAYFDIKVGAKSPTEIPNAGRDNLAELFAYLGYKRGAEIGVLRGDYSEVLCKANPSVHLYLVDPYKAYINHPRQAELDAAMALAKKRLEPYRTTHLHMPSMEAVTMIGDRSLDFVFIDGNHEWPWVTQDIYWWARKVRPGGIVSGHDYRRSRWKKSIQHTVEAVNGFTSAYRIHPWFVLGSKATRPGEVRDFHRSWFWVKP